MPIAPHTFIAAVLVVAAFMAFTGYTWLRLDMLADAFEEARPGGRMRRAHARQIGAAVGWWLVALSVLLWSVYTAAQITLPLFAIGVGLIVLAIHSRRRGDAPLFWGAV